MFAPWLLSTEPTAATIPVRSLPCTISDAWSRASPAGLARGAASWVIVTQASLPLG